VKIRWTPPDFHDTVFTVQRAVLQNRAQDLLRTFKVVALLGPRQSGKTTLARQIASALKDFPAERNYFDLEDPVHLDRLENPKLALEGLRGLVVIDEIQRRPKLFPVLRVLADRPGPPAACAACAPEATSPWTSHGRTAKSRPTALLPPSRAKSKSVSTAK
jgi:predicted AAA+ superfamily ATPase